MGRCLCLTVLGKTMLFIKVTLIFLQLYYKNCISEVAWVRSKAKLTLNSPTHGLRYGMVQKTLYGTYLSHMCYVDLNLLTL